MIIETDLSDIGYGGILTQNIILAHNHTSSSFSKEQVVSFHSGIWLGPQKNYSTIKKRFYLLFFVFQNFKMTFLTKKKSFKNRLQICK